MNVYARAAALENRANRKWSEYCDIEDKLKTLEPNSSEALKLKWEGERAFKDFERLNREASRLWGYEM